MIQLIKTKMMEVLNLGELTENIQIINDQQ